MMNIATPTTFVLCVGPYRGYIYIYIYKYDIYIYIYIKKIRYIYIYININTFVHTLPVQERVYEYAEVCYSGTCSVERRRLVPALQWM